MSNPPGNVRSDACWPPRHPRFGGSASSRIRRRSLMGGTHRTNRRSPSACSGWQGTKPGRAWSGCSTGTLSKDGTKAPAFARRATLGPHNFERRRELLASVESANPQVTAPGVECRQVTGRPRIVLRHLIHVATRKRPVTCGNAGSGAVLVDQNRAKFRRDPAEDGVTAPPEPTCAHSLSLNNNRVRAVPDPLMGAYDFKERLCRWGRSLLKGSLALGTCSCGCCSEHISEVFDSRPLG